MTQIIKFEVGRDDYDIRDCANASVSVGELIDILSHYDKDTKIVFSNDEGYTYGAICEGCLEDEWVKTKEEEEREQKMEDLDAELADLKWEYEFGWDDDDESGKMGEEEYLAKRAKIFEDYGVTEEEFKKFTY